jgi:hypothetical protein
MATDNEIMGLTEKKIITPIKARKQTMLSFTSVEYKD